MKFPLTLQTDIGNLVSAHFKELYDILADEKRVIATFAPQIFAFEDVLRQQRVGLEELQLKRAELASIRDAFKKVYSTEDAVDAEYRAA